MPAAPEFDYRAAMEEIARLMEDDPACDTPEGDRLDALVSLVEAYERALFAVGRGDERSSESGFAPDT
ncbi:hypothetical protein [Niveibacterium sp.]|uniref:hypothetical protein n=1 Tax=Niveibacterium sp. TaxID=2017444 RepID=UPI0035B2DF24